MSGKIEARSHIFCFHERAERITYSDCASVALGIQYVKRMLLGIL